jgi:hypothetical protein
LLTILLFVLSWESRAIDSTGVSSTLVLRMQLQSIADEVVEQANLDQKIRVALFVEGEGPRSLAENAFVESLQKRSFTSVLEVGTSLEQTLQVFFLSTNIKMRELDAKYSEREISTALEARTVIGTEHKVRLLGTFHRATKDTALVFPSLPLSIVPANEKESVMQRLLTPVIILGGAVLIVYLLFTVRS